MEQFPFLSLQQEDRHEGEDDDGQGEEDRPADLFGGSDDDLQPLFRPLLGRHLGQVAVAVLHHDDPGIHQHADGDGNTPQGHDVGGDPHQLHGDEGDQHRDRQGQDDHQGALEVEQEDQDHQRDDDRFLQQACLQGIDGPLDQVGAVVGDHDLHAGRQPFLQFLDLDLDPVDDILGILAVAHDDDAADRLTLAVHVQQAAPDGAPHLDGARGS